MTKPYYIKIKDPHEFLRHYLNIYRGDYNKRRALRIVSNFPEVRNKTILDVGCGGGFYSSSAQKKGAQNITLVDASRVCVKAAKINLKRTNPTVEGIVADATKLPFKEGCFDFVLCIDLIEHIPNDNVLLYEIRRTLKAKGLMLLATQNSNSFNYIIEAPLQRFILKNRNWKGWDPTHLRFYNHKRLICLLNGCGFQPIKIDGTYFIPYLMAKWLNKFSPKFSAALQKILISINDKLESNSCTPWRALGWGIIFLCVKK